MKPFLLIASFFVFGLAAAQVRENQQQPDKHERRSLTEKPKENPKASIDQYRIITLEHDTTYVDTSLTIKKDYAFNYLRKDIFGLMPFANEGQTYTTLQFGLHDYATRPEFGYKAKHFNYLEAKDVRYYSVATPFTDLYFKTVMEQGQNLDAFFTANTSENLNFSVAYKGLRSLGKYINQLSSTGNFRFTTSYNTDDKRYFARFHFVSQDLSNGENGGIVSDEDFESENTDFKNRARLEVYFKDAKSFMKGYRLFLDHEFLINGKPGDNNLYLTHQMIYERKFFEYSQPTLLSTITNDAGQTSTLQRYGPAFVTGNITDQVHYNSFYNRAGAEYENETLGRFGFYIDDYRYNYYYDKVLLLDSGLVLGSLSDKINSVIGRYRYRKGKWNGDFSYTNAISGPAMSALDAKLEFASDAKNVFSARLRHQGKVPDLNYELHQSSYYFYNWAHDFSNEKINTLEGSAQTQWGNAEVKLQTLDDFLYFGDDSTDGTTQLVSPKQYGKTIKYVSVKVAKEFRFWKLALDNTLLYQQVEETDPIVNVPKFTTRNTLYLSQYLFKRALFLQTGVTFNYFTKYYADGYQPMLAEFYTQRDKEIGGFPMLDFFVNGRIRQTRIFFRAEHFNSAMTGNDYYSAPHYPYRDFMIRFGLVWDFFQ
jgi:hypothetical protein